MQTESRKLPRILLAEDQAATRDAIAAFLLRRHKDRCELIGTVADGMTLISETIRLAPDIAVVDIAMPGLNGVAATAELTRRNCQTKVIMLTMYWEPEFQRAAFEAGAAGFVLKHRMVTDLPLAIEAALRGERFVSPIETVPRK